MLLLNYSPSTLRFRILILCMGFTLLFSSCSLSTIEELQTSKDNFLLIGDQPISFFSAKITLLRPVDVAEANGHYWANLELSTDVEFRTPFIPNSSIITIGVHAVYDGESLPKFPLKNGDYKVFSASGITDQEIFPTLVGKNFTIGPIISLSYIPNDLTFATFHNAESGTVNLTFDLAKNRVIVKHNWTTTDGIKISGTNNLPIDLSAFVP